MMAASVEAFTVYATIATDVASITGGGPRRGPSATIGILVPGRGGIGREAYIMCGRRLALGIIMCGWGVAQGMRIASSGIFITGDVVTEAVVGVAKDTHLLNHSLKCGRADSS